MKCLARSYVWWPGCDTDIGATVRGCEACEQNLNAPAAAPLHPWEWPERPWGRLHLDFAGPFLGKMFLIVVDSHSKWLEVELMLSTTSTVTIGKLRKIFATHGLPEMIVTDNEPQFISEEFRSYLRSNGIRHATSAPYHPASNGMAERAVQIFKRRMRKMDKEKLPLEEKLAKVLFSYRDTHQSTTRISSAELLYGRRLRGKLDLLKPDVAARVRQQQARQKGYHDLHAATRGFVLGQRVWVRQHSGPWEPGLVVAVSGPVSLVEMSDHRRLRCHSDQVRVQYSDAVPPSPAPTSSVSGTGSRVEPHADTGPDNDIRADRSGLPTVPAEGRERSLDPPPLAEPVATPQSASTAALEPLQPRNTATGTAAVANDSPARNENQGGGSTADNSSTSPQQRSSRVAPSSPEATTPPLRRSSRVSKPPQRLDL